MPHSHAGRNRLVYPLGQGAQLKRVLFPLCLVFNRPPNEEEMKISESVLEEENLFVLCRSLLNANEFVYFD